ncbi:MAG: polysaccharide biosynthesis tyrosine autokinase [Pirellulales bacterium]|nr:polysaccharide biosynthesis tyrosine autokinase [Pirellulales bacterium]
MIRQNDNGHIPAPEIPEGLLYENVLRGVWRRKSRVLLGLLLGVVAGAFCWSYWPPAYASRAQLLVVKRKTSDRHVVGVSPQFPEFEDYLSAQQALLSSPLVVRKAVEDGKLERLRSLQTREPDADPAAAIIGGLTVSRDSEDGSGHALLTLSYRGSEPADCKVIVEAIVASYKAHLAETQTIAAGEIQKMFTQWRDEVQDSISRKQQAYRALRESTPAAEWTGKDGVNLSQERLAQLEAQRLTQTVRQTEIQERLAALTEAQQSGASREELTQMISHWSEPWQLAAGKETALADKVDAKVYEQLLALRLKEQSLPESYGPGHPQVKAIREQVRVAEQTLLRESGAETTGAAAAGAGGDILTVDPVKAYLAALHKDLRVAAKTEQTLSELIRREQDRARQINDLNEDMAALLAQIGSAESLQEQIAQQLQSLSVFHDSDLYHAQVISPAVEGQLVAPQPRLLFPAAAFLGILAGAALAYLAELRDESFRTPEEVRERLRLPVIAHTAYCRIANRRSGRSAQNGRDLAAVLCTYFTPDSAESEAYRLLRSRLCLSQNGRPKPVIQITSPNRGDGKSTVSANLAVSMAQLGRRVVLVDADFRRPSLHKVFGVSSETGILSVLAGLTDLSDAIQETSVPNLSLLPCESAPQGSAELLSQNSFQKLLDDLRGQFDFVLIDTPPVLGASDACVVAHHADSVLLALSNTRHVRPLAEQAVQTLADQEARLIGVVVNDPARGRSRNHGYAIPRRLGTY